MTQVERTKKNIFSCQCKFCPSYSAGCLLKAAPQMAKVFLVPGSLKKETQLENLFCAYPASKCIKEKKGCKCPSCPVQKEYDLNGAYYCLPKQ